MSASKERYPQYTNQYTNEESVHAMVYDLEPDQNKNMNTAYLEKMNDESVDMWSNRTRWRATTQQCGIGLHMDALPSEYHQLTGHKVFAFIDVNEGNMITVPSDYDMSTHACQEEATHACQLISLLAHPIGMCSLYAPSTSIQLTSRCSWGAVQLGCRRAITTQRFGAFEHRYVVRLNLGEPLRSVHVTQCMLN
jgi:hypothetical protein